MQTDLKPAWNFDAVFIKYKKKNVLIEQCSSGAMICYTEKKKEWCSMFEIIFCNFSMAKDSYEDMLKFGRP